MSIDLVPINPAELPAPSPGFVAVPGVPEELVPRGDDTAAVVAGRVPFLPAPGGGTWALSPTAAVRVPFAPTPGGGVSVATVPGSDPEGVYRATGRRPAVPLVVYTLRQATDDLSAVPDNGSFVVDAAYAPHAGDGLYDFGATSGAIGSKVVRSGLPTVVVFRPPAPAEVVRLVNLSLAGPGRDGGLYRWDGSVWKPYASMPQRAARGMRAFEVLDPDRVYDFWASLLGGLQYCMTADAASLTSLLDADLVPDDYLGLLGSMLGVVVPAADTPAVRRYRVRTAVARNRLRGLNQGVALRLFLMGYVGYATEVWVNPAAGDNWTDPADAPADVQDAIYDAGLAVDPASGLKGQDWIEVAHGTQDAYDALGAGYVPSSRIVVHVNNRDGTPVSGTMSAGSVAALKRDASRALAEDVLPAQVTVRFFATDEAGGVVRYL